MSSRQIGEQFEAHSSTDLRSRFWRAAEVVVFEAKTGQDVLVSGFGMVPHLDQPGTWLICGDVRVRGQHSLETRFYVGTYSLVTGYAKFSFAGEEYRQQLYSMFSGNLADDLLSRAVAHRRLAKRGKYRVDETQARQFAVEEGKLGSDRATAMVTALRKSYARGNREFLGELQPPRGFEFDLKTVVTYLDRGEIVGIGRVFDAFLRRWLEAIS